MAETYVSTELRALVTDRAAGCCEYCRLPQLAAYYAFEIDHVVPEKHGGRSVADNLAFACFACNRHKGTDLASMDPLSGEIVPIFNPRCDRWSEHFEFAGPRIRALTAAGRVTARLLHFNEPDRVREREPLLRAGVMGPPKG